MDVAILGKVIDRTMDWVMTTALPISWYCTFACMAFSARIATGFLKHNPRLFTVMALFACMWLHVLGYYALQIHGQQGGELSNLLTDLASVLLIYIGGLLVLDANEAAKGGSPLGQVVTLQLVAFVMLFFIAIPRGIEITAPDPEKMVKILPVESAKHAVSAILDVLASVSIALGAWRISSTRAFSFLIMILIFYGGAQVAELLPCTLNACPNPDRLDEGYALIFAVQKVAFTASFGYIVAYHGMTDQWRKAGWQYWILHFFYIAPDPPK